MSANTFDDLDRKKIDETFKTVRLLVEQVAQLQTRLDKVIQLKQDTAWGRRYLRQIISRQKTKLIENQGYIRELENELRLRGLE